MRRKDSIRDQIFKGYRFIILLMICMTMLTVSYSLLQFQSMQQFNILRADQTATKNAEVGHYSWIMQLEESILQVSEFHGSLDPNNCGLGKWLQTLDQSKGDPEILAAVARLQEPHRYIHAQASEILTMAQTDVTAAHEHFLGEVKPVVAIVISEIALITQDYTEQADALSNRVTNNLKLMACASIVLLAGAVVLSTVVGGRMAQCISKPVLQVTQWAQELAVGNVSYKPGEVDTSPQEADNEISQMMGHFRHMADSVKQTVQVVIKVADGDLTPYVDIRSDEDILGSSLYRMVQNNNYLFSRVRDIATYIDERAGQISSSGIQLAQNAYEQAATLEDISNYVTKIYDLACQNTEHVQQVRDEFGQIQGEMRAGAEKMDTLIAAVQEISYASNGISAIIKTIDEIAFQTNILALNAAIEAARAGLAGKGFAVVADEVRLLALRSTEAAASTEQLIRDSMQKSGYGATVAAEAADTFGNIDTMLRKTSDVMEEIAAATVRQGEAISDVRDSVLVIAEVGHSLADFSQETSGTSQSMKRRSQELQQQMSNLLLRHHESGKPYIPPEKRNDAAFIREATLNYERAKKRGGLLES